jgi:hypothetical protein
MEQARKADFDAVPVIDFSLATTDRELYFKQLKFAVEDVGFGVSGLIILSPRGVLDLWSISYSRLTGFQERPRL